MPNQYALNLDKDAPVPQRINMQLIGALNFFHCNQTESQSTFMGVYENVLAQMLEESEVKRISTLKLVLVLNLLKSYIQSWMWTGASRRPRQAQTSHAPKVQYLNQAQTQAEVIYDEGRQQ